MKRAWFLGTVVWLFSIVICFPQMQAPMYESIEDAQIASENGMLVTRLDLTKQKLSKVPEEIKAYKDLVELRLDKNRIVSIPSWISELSKLELFSAERNKIDEFPLAILTLDKLRHVYLGDNLISDIPINIDHLGNLEWLGLWSNLIRNFPASLSNIQNLKTLDLLHNDMTYLEQTWLRELLPDVALEMSEPCNCMFDE